MPTQAEITKAALAMTVAVAKMNDVTKTYWLALGEDAQTAFLTKSADEQKVEAETAKTETDRKAAEAEAAKSGKTVEYVALEKSNTEMRAEIALLKAQRADDEIAKRAETEFAGYPGGAKEVVSLLKAYAGLPEAARVASEAVLKAQCVTAKSLTQALGGRSEAEVSKAETANKKVTDAAKALAEEKKIPFADAWEQTIEKAEFAEDVAAL